MRISGVFLLLALWIISSNGVTLSTHLCGGQKIKSAVSFTKVELTCGMKMAKRNCPSHPQVNTVCCNNEFEFFQISENVIPGHIKLVKSESSSDQTTLFSFTELQRVNVQPIEDSPPLLRTLNRMVQFQTFRI